MEKSGDCDSDGSISWEDFFGSSTDLVPTLLTMYDSLIAQSLSGDHLASNHVPSDQVRWASTTATMNSRTTNMSLNMATSTHNPSPLSLETKHNTDAQYTDSNNGDWKSGSATNGTESSSTNKKTVETNSNANNINKTIVSSRNSVNQQQQQLRYGITNRSLSRWSESNNASVTTTPINTRTHNSSTTNGNHTHGGMLLLDTCSGKEQRPLSVNSVISSTSSSSCSSESSTSLSNVLGLAPRASPEEEDCATIPDADISEDDETTAIKSNYRCAKTSDQINGTERCFNKSAAKDCGENASRGSRISYPIPTQGKPRFCDPNLSYMDRVVMEIVETERIYVTDLREIISGYLEHWKLQPDESLSLSDITELFSNIEEIHKFNGEFLTLLEGCDLNPVQVARCFVTKNEGFSIYTQYCTNYPRTMSILTEMMRHEQSAKSFRERQASLGHTLPLGSYLLKPVQRILKYHLLLQNIVKHYDHGAEGYKAIVEALSAMTNIAHHINDMKRRHEHAVRVQEIQSLLYGWQGEDLTTYGELCAEGTFRVYGAKALRHVFLFDKMVLITKKKEDGILSYKSHIMCSNLMLIESVPGEPLSFHVIPFDNPRFQCTLQARNLEQKREWTLQLKRVILENYHAVIPTHARQLVMELGQCRPEDEAISEKAPTKRQHSAPEYLERRKQEKERRKSESTLKARLRRARKSDTTSPKESPTACRRSRRTSVDSSRERSESRDREVAIDRKMSSASCPPSGTTEKRLVKKLSGWRRKSEPGFYLHQSARKSIGGKGTAELMSPNHGTSNLTLDSNESIGEEGGEEEEDESSSQIDLCSEENELDEVDESCLPNVEERRESIEEIVGQLVMQNREFQRILSKQRLVHLRKALAQHQQRHLHEEETASETETEDHQHERVIRPTSINKKCIIQDSTEKLSGSGASQVSSSNGIGSSSELNENSSENISIGANDDELMHSSKNVQRTVSDPGNKATLTPRRFISGPFAHYDPLSLLWSSFRRNDNRSNKQGNSPIKSKGKTNIRHTHSFTCSHKDSMNGGTETETKEPLPITHGDSGVFPNSFTSDSSSSSEANIPTLPAVWLKQQDAHLATPNNKSGSLPRSFQVGQHTMPVPKAEKSIATLPDSFGFKSRLRDGKYADRPFTIASDKPSPSDISFDEMEQYMSKFNDQMVVRNSSNSLSVTEDVDDLATELTPVTSIENISLHPDHKIYRSSKSSIKHMLLSVTHRLSGLKANMMAGGSNGGSGSNRGALAFGSYPNIATTADNNKDSDRAHQPNQQHGDGVALANGHGKTTGKGAHYSSMNVNNSAVFRSNYRKSLKQKIRHIVKEDRDSDSENCESVTCSSNGSSGFGSLGSCGSSTNNLTSKIGARLAQSSEHSDYALSKLLGSALNESLSRRPQSVMSVSSTVTSSSSTDEKISSGLGEESLSESNGSAHSQNSNGESQSCYRSTRKAINHRDLYLSYIDQEAEGALSDSDASADSFYERSFEAIENFLESEMFPDSAIYSGDENGSSSNSSAGGGLATNWSSSSRRLDDNESLCAAMSSLCTSTHHHNLHSSDLNSLSISALASRLSNSKLLVGNSQSAPNSNGISTKANSIDDSHRRSRLVRSQVILEKLKHLEQCSQFHREEPPSPSFEGIKSIQERRKELDLWRVGMANREDESETSSQHSTSTINTVIELSLSPSKSTSIPSSRRCSDTDSSGGNSPLTERAISRNGNHSQSQGDLGEPMPKGWVKLVVGKLQGET